jgi:SAM-dependent methyltransferase
MGRWSRRLAPLFIEHAGDADGEEVLEIGCGTGSVTFALAETAGFARLTAIDQSKVDLAAAQAKNRDPRIRIAQGDGCALRFADASFDRTLFWDTAAALDARRVRRMTAPWILRTTSLGWRQNHQVTILWSPGHPNGNKRAAELFWLGAIAPCGEMRQADAPMMRVCRTGMADRAKAKMTLTRNACIRPPSMTGGE